MKSFQRLSLVPVLAALAAATCALPAGAQSNPAPAMGADANAYNRDAFSLLPYTRRGYLGLNLGRTEFNNACGSGGYACDNAKGSAYLYTGGLFNDALGLELGYLNTGKSDRSGGDSRAEGVNLLAVLRAPFGPFSVFAKGGAVYAQTRVTTGLLSDVPSGRRRDWGGAYGAGLGFDFTPNAGLVLEWTRREVRFPGNDSRQDLDSTTLGYVYRF
jgi:hypothetical protein